MQFDTLDNYARKPVAHLPTLKISGIKNAVVQVIEEKTGELIYALRLNDVSWQPHVFAPGKYTVKISEPETSRQKEIKGLEAATNNKLSMQIGV